MDIARTFGLCFHFFPNLDFFPLLFQMVQAIQVLRFHLLELEKVSTALVVARVVASLPLTAPPSPCTLTRSPSAGDRHSSSSECIALQPASRECNINSLSTSLSYCAANLIRHPLPNPQPLGWGGAGRGYGSAIGERAVGQGRPNPMQAWHSCRVPVLNKRLGCGEFLRRVGQE